MVYSGMDLDTTLKKLNNLDYALYSGSESAV